MVTEIIVKLNDFTLGELYMFIHKPLLTSALAVLEDSQQLDRIDTALHPFAEEYMAAVEHHARRLLSKSRQFLADFLYQLWKQILVGVKPQHPSGISRQLVKRPVELVGVIVNPFVLEDVNCRIFGCNIQSPVSREAVYHIYGLGNRQHILDTTSDVKLLVFGQYDDCQYVVVI